MSIKNMVLGRLLIKAGEGILIDKAAHNIAEAYERHKANKAIHFDEIGSYRISDTNYFRGGTLKDVAQRYGLENILSDYKQSIFHRINSYLAELKTATSDLKNAFQNLNMGHDYELSFYAALQKAHDLMSGVLGYSPKPIIPKGAYLSDIANSYLDEIGEMNKKLDRFLAAASGFNTDGSGIGGVFSKRTARFVANQVLEKIGAPGNTLDKILASTKPFAELRKEAKPLFAEYNDVVRKWHAYASDLVYAA